MRAFIYMCDGCVFLCFAWLLSVFWYLLLLVCAFFCLTLLFFYLLLLFASPASLGSHYTVRFANNLAGFNLVVGLKLVLNLEQSEYIHELASGTGLRLVLSEPGTFAMPSEDGITISGGFDTNIGLRKVSKTVTTISFGTPRLLHQCNQA